MSYTMFLDDLRLAENHYPNDPEMVTVRTFHEAVDYIEEHGLPSFISFDHDLGDTNTDVELTGYSLAKYIIDYMFENEITEPFQYFIHSANPIGEANIRAYLENGFKAVREHWSD